MATTVVELDNKIKNNLGDPNSQTWVQSQRLVALNEAQEEIINHILGFAIFDPKVYEILAELQVKENVTVNHGGLALNTDLKIRHYMANGFVAMSVEVDNKIRWCKKVLAANLGQQMNRYKKGTNSRPQVYIWQNQLNLLLDIGAFPVSSDIYYIGMPYKLGLVNDGSGPDQTVEEVELNSQLHHIMVKIAEVNLLYQRMDEADIVRIQSREKTITDDIRSLVTGKVGEPGDEKAKGGEYLREATRSSSDGQVQ